MSAWLGLLGGALLALGGVLLLVAAWGVLALPDALSRQHAATKAGTLALSTVLCGAGLLHPNLDWGWRLALLLGFLLATLPVASHLLARAALRELERAQTAAIAEAMGKIDDEADRP